MAEKMIVPDVDMAARIDAYDWTSTPLGPRSGWPQSLRWAIGLCLHSSFPTALYWGDERTLLYNDAWISIAGHRHPAALGQPGGIVWGAVWPDIEPQLHGVVATGRGFSARDQPLPIGRDGSRVYVDYSFTPIAGDDGSVEGVLNQARDVTAEVHQRQHDRFMLTLDDSLRGERDPQIIIDIALRQLREALDLPRVGYAEIDAEAGQVSILRTQTDGSMADIAGVFPLGNWGEAFSAGLRRGETMRVEDSAIDPLAASPQVQAAYAAAGIRAGMVVPYISSGRYSAGLFAHSPVPRVWPDHHAALMRSALQRLWRDVTRARVEMALRDSEERHRLIFEQARDIIFTADLDQVVTACNPATAAALGLTPDRVVGHSIAEFISPAEFERTSAMLGQKLSAGGTTGYELDVIAASGKQMRWEINSALSRDRDGRPTGLHAIARDVSDRRAFEDRQSLLINELNHRVKNTLTLVQALAFQSLRPDRDPAVSTADFQSRLTALSAAHDLLTREQWEGATLAELVESATNPLHRADPRIRAAGPHVQVRPKAAVSIVMALHELGTNATKYGALSDTAGHVDIGWTVVAGRLRLEWHEQGGPPVSVPDRQGFGIRMIERALASDLAGKVTIEFAPDGLRCTIVAPLEGDSRVAGRA